MSPIRIRTARKSDGPALLRLIDALADFEHLARPTAAARRRLLRDAFGRRKRFDVFLACDGAVPAGYAIVFDTYSSFLARPALYLEDIFVLPEYRHRGLGLKLFRKCLSEARRRSCGRMEWAVLDWNRNAIAFYDRLGAARMKEWLLYRIVL